MHSLPPRPLRSARQNGYTLVELMSVMVILGALTATALPKFADATGDARYVSLANARGALTSMSAMAHGKFMSNKRSTQTLDDVTVTLVHGYPAATQASADAAGLSGDYTVYTQVAGPTASTPNVAAGSMSIVPNSIAGTATAVNCYLVYEQASATSPAPRIKIGGHTTAATCV